MKKYLGMIGLCVAVLVLAQGCEQLSELSKAMAGNPPSVSWWQNLQLGYAPKNLVFTKTDVEKGKERALRVWNRIPFMNEMKFTVEADKDWVLVDPEEGSSVGPWDREWVSVKLDSSVLGDISNTAPLESAITIKVTDSTVEKQVKVYVIDNYQGLGNLVRDRVRERIQAWLGNIFRWRNPNNGNGGNGNGNGAGN